MMQLKHLMLGTITFVIRASAFDGATHGVDCQDYKYTSALINNAMELACKDSHGNILDISTRPVQKYIEGRNTEYYWFLLPLSVLDRYKNFNYAQLTSNRIIVDPQCNFRKVVKLKYDMNNNNVVQDSDVNECSRTN
ncbi:BgTH12-03282 [Blumeria graminis f. sp. triticale]|uniref:BgtE-20126 n=2 Tax=Blumeria graminis TaxID=34373 RepID=A0A9X9MJR5_BLUGR|nr:BgTH12-03282 [Blumeria graminis f. sp. triticale]VDB89785.1 BgtE-20126 [Blumeria graminis f. sp. tritici]